MKIISFFARHAARQAAVCGLLLLVGIPFLFAQQGPPASNQTGFIPEITDPSAFLQTLLDNVDRVRRPIENWSPVERQALSEARRRAAEYCAYSSLDNSNPRTLLAIANLCALGNRWEEALKAASLYVTLPQAVPEDGLALVERSLLRLGRVNEAIATARQVENLAPFSPKANAILDEAIDSLQYGYPFEALGIARRRQPALPNLLETLRQSRDFTAMQSVYRSAMALPLLLRSEGLDAEAAQEFTRVRLLGEAQSKKDPEANDYLTDPYPFYSVLGKPLPWVARQTSKMTRLQSADNLRFVLMLPSHCPECDQLTLKFVAFARRHRQQGLRFVIGASAMGPRTSYAGTVELFTIDVKHLSGVERSQMAALDWLTRPALLITRGEGRLERVYYPTTEFFSADAGFDQLLPHLIHTPVEPNRH